MDAEPEPRLELLFGASVRFPVDGEIRTGVVTGFYRRERDPVVVVRLDDRTVEVPLLNAELIVKPRFPPDLIDKAATALGTKGEEFAMLALVHSVGEQALEVLRARGRQRDDSLVRNLAFVVEETRHEVEAAIRAANPVPN